MTDILAMDQADMTDGDVQRIARVWRDLMAKYARREATRYNLDELAREAQSRFFEIGLVAQVDVAKAYLGVGPPELTIMSYVPGHEYHKYGTDHELKHREINMARDLGE